METRPLLVVTLLLVGFPCSQSDTLKQSIWRHIERDYPYVLPSHSAEGDSPSTESAKKPFFDDLHLTKLRRLLKQGPLDGESELGRILDGDPIPTVDWMEQLDPAILERRLLHDEVYRERLQDFFVEYASELLDELKNRKAATAPEGLADAQDDDVPPVVTPNRDEDPDDPQDRDQVGGKEGCFRDYDTLALPATSSLLFSIVSSLPICEILLNNNFTGVVLDLLPFCDCHSTSPPFPPVWECTTDMTNMTGPNITSTQWGRRMVDALAKVPTGLADGKLHWVGGFEMCRSVDARYTYTDNSFQPPSFPPFPPSPPGDPVTEERHVKGRYCRMYLGMDVENSTASIPIAIGLCVPDTCEADWIYEYITQENLLFQAVGAVIQGSNITGVYCKMETDSSSDAFYQAVGAVVGFFVLLVCVAACYDIFGRKKFTINHYGAQLLEIHRSKERRRKAIQRRARRSSRAVTGSLPSGYTHVHTEELRRYSVGGLGINPEDLANLENSISIQPGGDSLVEELERKTQKKSFEPDENTLTSFERFELFIVGCSLYTNIHRLLDTSSPSHHLRVFDGIRVLSMAWTVLGGMYLWGPIYNECFLSANLFRTLNELPKQWSFQVVINQGFSSDSFLVISGTMITYWWLKRFEAKGKKMDAWMILHYIVHRYWRLAPAYMMVLFSYTGTYAYAGDSPFFTLTDNDGDNCKVNWWTNLLMVMNLVNADSQCMGWSWQVSILFQLHLVTLVVLIPMAIKPIFGYVMLGIMYLVSLASAAGVSDKVFDEPRWDAFYHEYMQTPWCRAGPFCVGLALGIIMHNFKKIKIHWSLVLCGWLLGLACVVTPIYITYDVWREGGEMWSRAGQVAYDTLARTAFGLGLAWIIFACHYGYGSIINTLLCLKVFQPLSKLTYGAYLAHVLLAYAWAYGRFTLFYFSTINMAWLFLAQMWINYLAGGIILLAFHYPISCAIDRAVTCKSRMHALLTGRHPGDYFDQFHLAQRIQVSDVDNSAKEEALRQAGFENPAAFRRQSSIASNSGSLGPPPAYNGVHTSP